MNNMETGIQETIKVYEAQSGRVKAQLEIDYDSKKQLCLTHFHLYSFTRYADGSEEELQSVDVRNVSRHPVYSMRNLELSQLALESLVQPTADQTFAAFGLLYNVRPDVGRVIGDLRTLVRHDFENKLRAGKE